MENVQSDIREIKEEFRAFRKEVKDDFSAARKQSEANFRLLFGAIITVALGLSSVMAKRFGWL
jgi:hypothetical protein